MIAKNPGVARIPKDPKDCFDNTVTRAHTHAWESSPKSSFGSFGIVLALDLGQSTGWALRTADGVITSGTAQFRPGRFEGGGMVYLRFRAWLQELDETAGGIGAVLFEEVRRHLGTSASHAYGGYLAHLTAWAEALKLPYEGVPVGTIKRHATGKGNAGKDEVIAAVRAKGFAPTDDNEADALALLDWAIAHRFGGGK